ncbi:MAG: sodium-dependent transporter [Bacteroidales bacterium]|nr:sodium-dependent transporter [Bacteroidales bacterium]
MTEHRSKDSFTSNFGMVAAAVGSAIGLGNLWRFPYLVGQNGGAAFIIVYLALTALISIPILLAESVIGRRGGGAPAEAYRKVTGRKGWGTAGILGMITCLMIMSFYVVVGGWTIKYMMLSCMWQFHRGAVIDSAAMFGAFTSGSISPIVYSITFIFLTIVIIMLGVQKGIERTSKLMMPMLFVLIILIGIRSITLPGAKAGIEYLFRPDFSSFTFDSLLAALGQSFFSLSLGACMMITYGAYTPRSSNLTRSAAIISVSDTFFALIAGCAIMPAVFAFGVNPSQGAGLVFVTLPQIFTQMPLGGVCSVLFFFALFLAAVSSAVSLFEVITSSLMSITGKKRTTSAAIVALILTVTGSVCSLSQGVLSGVTVAGLNIFDQLDYVSSNFLMTTGGLLTVICVGWIMGKDAFTDEITAGGTIRVSKNLASALFFVIKYIAPVVIATTAILIIV